jgi:hypothetical protein
MPWKKEVDVWWPPRIRVQVQQQRSLIMTIKNILHKINYDEQID